MQKEIITKTWLGKCVLCNRLYSVGKNKRDYKKRKKMKHQKNNKMAKRSLVQKIKC